MTTVAERPKPFLVPEYCKGCGRCIRSCPKDCIALGTEINPETGLVTTGVVASASVWNSTTNYAVGSFVFYNNTTYYLCTLPNTNQTPSSTSTYWTTTTLIAGARSLAQDSQGMGGK